MDASILDLRYKMKEVLNALNRREKVRILYHGKVKVKLFLEEIKSKTNPLSTLFSECLNQTKKNRLILLNKCAKQDIMTFENDILI